MVRQKGQTDTGTQKMLGSGGLGSQMGKTVPPEPECDCYIELSREQGLLHAGNFIVGVASSLCGEQSSGYNQAHGLPAALCLYPSCSPSVLPC